ncbi:MAG: amidohydrolase family protein [Rhodospirillales bacterium]|nr:MAG: amidohydrolase family protein [Rhodospirillales bacterium]
MTPRFASAAAALCMVAVLAAGVALAADRLPIIDAHSQAEDAIALERILELMNEAGVSRTILAARRKTTIHDMVQFARAYPDRITAAVRSKGGAYQDKTPQAFRQFLAKQLKFKEFTAMAETLIYHAEKTNRQGKTIAPQVAFPPRHEKVTIALKAALDKGWPFIPHIEFASLGGAERDRYMREFERMLRAYPRHPFLLIHMGQLGPDDVERLIAAHPNIHFITAHTTPVTLSRSREPWTAMFEGRSLAPPWRALILTHPDRFVLGFDNVWANHWETFYLPQVRLWREALAELPDAVAHAVAHGNAERLWGLPPAR